MMIDRSLQRIIDMHKLTRTQLCRRTGKYIVCELFCGYVEYLIYGTEDSLWLDTWSNMGHMDLLFTMKVIGRSKWSIISVEFCQCTSFKNLSGFNIFLHRSIDQAQHFA